MTNVFTFVLLLVAIGGFVKIATRYLEHRKSAPDEELEQTLAKVDALEERVRVLERVITEERYDLRKEIDGL